MAEAPTASCCEDQGSPNNPRTITTLVLIRSHRRQTFSTKNIHITSKHWQRNWHVRLMTLIPCSNVLK
eukprot:5856994-Amphidinium_carterae.1